jgi:hypothetical protein
MGNLSRVLEELVQQVNNSIKRYPQQLDEDTKKIVRDNIGAIAATDIPELESVITPTQIEELKRLLNNK